MSMGESAPFDVLTAFDEAGLNAIRNDIGYFMDTCVSVKAVVQAIDSSQQVQWQQEGGGGGGAGELTYWPAFKEEMRLLICTNDQKYADIRKKIEKSSDRSQSVLVGVISASIAATLGAWVGVITPLVILSLVVCLRMGRSAYCRVHNLDGLVPKTLQK